MSNEEEIKKEKKEADQWSLYIIHLKPTIMTIKNQLDFFSQNKQINLKNRSDIYHLIFNMKANNLIIDLNEWIK